MDYSFANVIDAVFPRFFAEANDIQCSEHNYATLLYYHLRHAGYTHKQVCREMYSDGIVSDGVRPDIVVMDEGISGRFNYYLNCDPHYSNVQLKKDNLRLLIEMKGGAHNKGHALDKFYPSDVLCEVKPRKINGKKNQYCGLVEDIDKLIAWREKFYSPTREQDYLFVALDMKNRHGPFPHDAKAKIAGYCRKQGIRFIYFAQGEHHFHFHGINKEPDRDIPIA